MTGTWAQAGVEPPLRDLLDDPLTRLVMHRDRLRPADVEAAMRCARERLGSRAERPVRRQTAPEPAFEE